MDRTLSLSTKQTPTIRKVIEGKFKRKSDGYFLSKAMEMQKSYPDAIQDFVQSTVCLKKEKTGLGISIIGGCDTHMARKKISFISSHKRWRIHPSEWAGQQCDQIPIWKLCQNCPKIMPDLQKLCQISNRGYIGGVLISAVSPKGAAGKDGRLKCGDQIVSVNGKDLECCSHEEAVQLLRLAKNPVRLTVYRENIEALFTNCMDPVTEFAVVLRKGINDNLGLGIYGRKDGKGVFVTYLAPGGLADACCLIKQGDRLLKCNGRDMRNASQQEAVNFLKNTFGEVTLLIGRTKDVEEVVSELIDKLSENTKSDFKLEVFPEKRPRSRSDCMSTKKNTGELKKKPKQRTVTMTEIFDTSTSSTLDLLRNQSNDDSFGLDNVNYGFKKEEDTRKKIESELKSTLKKHGPKGGRKTDHVSFEMTNANVRQNFLDIVPEDHTATNL
eukprot:gene19855-21795_t